MGGSELEYKKGSTLLGLRKEGRVPVVREGAVYAEGWMQAAYMQEHPVRSICWGALCRKDTQGRHTGRGRSLWGPQSTEFAETFGLTLHAPTKMFGLGRATMPMQGLSQPTHQGTGSSWVCIRNH